MNYIISFRSFRKPHKICFVIMCFSFRTNSYSLIRQRYLVVRTLNWCQKPLYVMHILSPDIFLDHVLLILSVFDFTSIFTQMWIVGLWIVLFIYIYIIPLSFLSIICYWLSGWYFKPYIWLYVWNVFCLFKE